MKGKLIASTIWKRTSKDYTNSWHRKNGEKRRARFRISQNKQQKNNISILNQDGKISTLLIQQLKGMIKNLRAKMIKC